MPLKHGPHSMDVHLFMLHQQCLAQSPTGFGAGEHPADGHGTKPPVAARPLLWYFMSEVNKTHRYHQGSSPSAHSI